MDFTSIALVNMLKSHIEHSVLFTDNNKPDGKLCEYERPLGSKSEDVVISVLSLLKDDVDNGILNVNIYVPNLILADEPNDTSQPDTARIQILSDLANEAFADGEEIWDDNGGYCFKLQQDNVLSDENDQHYINLQIEFYS